MKRVVVTGGGGQIAYSLLFKIASGELLGSKEAIFLSILEIPQAVSSLQGVVLELQDCCFPLLQGIRVGSNPEEIFEGAEIVFLVGSKPRSPGMERKELLQENGKIFIEQGKALNISANRKEVVVLVIGNPCNTNCLIALSHAPDIDPFRFHAMTRLDQNRATYQLAVKAKTKVSDISQMTIWGNHSSTQVPDFHNALIRGTRADVVIQDKNWLETDFIEAVQQRGARVLKERGKSSAASAAQAALDAMRALLFPSENLFSSAILAKDNPYGISEDIVFSFPLRCVRRGKMEIVPNLEWTDFMKKKIRESEKELIQEKNEVM